MTHWIKENVVLIVAFSLPLLVLSALALSAYVPNLFLKTDYNFIYASCNDNSNYFRYECDEYLQKRLQTDDGRLKEVDVQFYDYDDNLVDYAPRIFLHDTKTNESREITLEEAKTYTLNPLITSPDGITINDQYNRSSGYFLFYGGNSSYGHYLTKGNASTKLNLISDPNRYNYRDTIHFIGWALPGRSN